MRMVRDIGRLLCLVVWGCHRPELAMPGMGFRCGRCGLAGTTQGELLGVDDQIDYWKLSEKGRGLVSGQIVVREPSEVVRGAQSGTGLGMVTVAAVGPRNLSPYAKVRRIG